MKHESILIIAATRLLDHMVSNKIANSMHTACGSIIVTLMQLFHYHTGQVTLEQYKAHCTNIARGHSNTLFTWIHDQSKLLSINKQVKDKTLRSYQSESTFVEVNKDTVYRILCKWLIVSNAPLLYVIQYTLIFCRKW